MRKFVSVSGFLLTEFIIAFALINFAVLLFAQSIYYSIHEYHQAKERIGAIDVACNEIEKLWTGRSHIDSTSHSYDINIETMPIMAQNLFPNQPRCVQQIMDVSWKDNNTIKKVSVCCGIKEK